MRRRFLAAISIAALSVSAVSAARADDSKSYTEGTVTTVTSIRTKPGMFETYMKWLDTAGKQIREDEKKAGIILDYAIYSAEPRSPQDPDLYMTVTYKNMAALDGLNDREEPIIRKLWSTRDATDKASIDRESMREILGTQLIRRLNLK
jgi:hypothetical protein